jgi:hypothetical protein
MIRLILPALMLCLSLSAPCLSSGDKDNGATWYLKAIDQMKALPGADWDLIYDYVRDRTVAPSPEVRDVLARAEPVLALIRRGASQEYVGYGLDRSSGLSIDLPHLAEVRKLTRLMQADAIVRLHDRDARGAAARLAVVYQMAGQLRDDRAPISSYLGHHLIIRNDALIGQAIDNAVLDAPACATLLSAVDALDRSDPAGLTEAIAVQQEHMLAWLESQREDPASRAELVEVYHPIEAESDLLAPFATMDAEAFTAEVEQYDAVMNRMMGAFAESDPESAHSAIKALQEEIGEGRHGRLALFLFDEGYLTARLDDVFDSMHEARQALEDGRTRLEQIVRGRSIAEDAADNAAVWYLMAVDRVDRMEPERLEELRRIEAGSLVALDDGSVATLRQADDVVELFRRGASVRRCDFSFAREAGPAFIPTYLPGMNDGLRLLHLDAIRLIGAGRAAEATERLALVFRIAVHLSEDQSILSSPLAHTWVNHTFAVTEEAAGEELLGGREYRRLATAIDHMSRTDPFGYLANARIARDLASRRWERRFPRHEAATGEAIAYRIAHGSYDDLAYWLAGIEAVEHTASERGAPQPDISRLADVLSPSALLELRECVLSAATLGQSIDRTLLEYDDGEHRPITSIADRIKEARADLRACRTFLSDHLVDDEETGED